MSTTQPITAQQGRPEDWRWFDSLSGEARHGGIRVRNPDATILMAVLAGMIPSSASARYGYTWVSWVSRTDPAFEVSYAVSDDAIKDGTITPEEIPAPEGVSAKLVAGSVLAVDSRTGAVVTSTNSLTATNPQNTPLLSASGFLVPASRRQSHGHGRWNVIDAPDSANSLMYPGMTTNTHPELQFTDSANAPANVSFILQATADFAVWMPIATNQTENGVATAVDPEPAIDPSRFYRALITP
jgi:hypothetical protein